MKLSIIIPAYNAAQYIKKCISGLTNLDDVVCIHCVAQSWNANAGLSTREQTNPKKKTLRYRKMLLQRKLADWILKV